MSFIPGENNPRGGEDSASQTAEHTLPEGFGAQSETQHGWLRGRRFPIRLAATVFWGEAC